MRDEVGFVLLCCRVFVKTAGIEELGEFVREHELDWEVVYAVSARHRVRPLVYRVLSGVRGQMTGDDLRNEMEKINCEDLPEPGLRNEMEALNNEIEVEKMNGPITALRNKEALLRQKWEKMHAGLAQFNQFCRSFSMLAFNRQMEMLRIEGVLRKNGVKVKQYKGMDFAKLVYGDIGMREFTDMDMMIDIDDVPALIETMISEGYTCKRIAYFRKFPHKYVATLKDICFEKPCQSGGIFGFEFHYRPVKYFMYEAYSFSDLLGKDYLSQPISRADYYQLMLLNHGSSDFFPDLKAIVDMILLDGSQEQLPAELRRFERLWQAVAVQLLHYKVLPAGLATDRALMRTAEAIIQRLLRADTGKIGYVRKIRLQMGFDQRVGRKIKTIARGITYLLLPNGEDIKQGGSAVYSLYYFTKFIRLCKKHVRI